MELEMAVEKFIERADRMRALCVKEHRYPSSALGFYGKKPLETLMDHLDMESRPARGTGAHQVLSSYAFWGMEPMGVSLDRRPFFEAMDHELGEVYEGLKKGDFAAWRCEYKHDKAGWWRALGPRRATPQEMVAVTDHQGEVVERGPGDVVLAWCVDVDGELVLAFSVEVDEEMVKTLEEGDEDEVWTDHSADPPKFQGGPYEEDLLRLMVNPGRSLENLGLEKLYFLPRRQRQTFPKRFRRQLSRDLMESVGGKEGQWMVALAEGNEPWKKAGIRAWLQSQRRQSARRLFFYRRSTFDLSKLDRLVGDRECLAMLGLSEDGEIDESRLPPLWGQPARLLDLASGLDVPRGLTIGELKEWVESRDDEEVKGAIEEALEVHRSRLKWIALVQSLQEGSPSPMVQLPPGYEELIEIQRRFFKGLRHRLVSSLLKGARQGKRIVEGLEKALGTSERPLIVGDLPEEKWALTQIKGVGPKSVDSLVEGLWEAMMNWEEMGRAYGDEGVAREQIDEARKQIDEGLEALEDLFG